MAFISSIRSRGGLMDGLPVNPVSPRGAVVLGLGCHVPRVCAYTKTLNWYIVRIYLRT